MFCRIKKYRNRYSTNIMLTQCSDKKYFGGILVKFQNTKQFQGKIWSPKLSVISTNKHAIIAIRMQS